MHSLVIEHRGCPRCRIQLTARFGKTWFCFNCRSQLSTDAPAVSRDSETALEYPFTEREGERLHIYRAAVRAGFYTDWLRTVPLAESERVAVSVARRDCLPHTAADPGDAVAVDGRRGHDPRDAGK